MLVSSTGFLSILTAVFAIFVLSILDTRPTDYSFFEYVMFMTPIALVGSSLCSALVSWSQVRLFDASNLAVMRWKTLSIITFTASSGLCVVLSYPLLLLDLRYFQSNLGNYFIAFLIALPGIATGIAQQTQLPDRLNRASWILISSVTWPFPLIVFYASQTWLYGRIYQIFGYPSVAANIYSTLEIVFAISSSGLLVFGTTVAYITLQQSNKRARN